MLTTTSPFARGQVLSRGNERRDIFADDQDRGSFLEILGEMSERFEVEVHAYVLIVLLCKNFFSPFS